MSEASSHVLVFPYPFQGHINPMIQLSKRLSKKGLTVTLIIASNNHREPYTSDDYSITVHTIHDGFLSHEHPQTKFDEPQRFINSTTRSLTDFISRYKFLDEFSSLTCKVYSIFLKKWKAKKSSKNKKKKLI